MATNEKQERAFVSHEYDSMYPPLYLSPGTHTPMMNGASVSSKTFEAPNVTLGTTSKATKDLMIGPSHRRFSEMNNSQIQNILKSVCHKFQVQIQPSYTRMGSLTIGVTGKDESLVEQAKFALREQLSTQSSVIINVNPKNLPRLLGRDRKNIQRFTKGYYADVQVDADSGKLLVTGGQASVAFVSESIRNYIAVTIDSVTMEVTIPHEYHIFLQGPNNKTVDEIIKNSGSYVKVKFPEYSHNSDQITITGLKINVEAVANAFKQLYYQLQSLSVERMQLSFVQKAHLLRVINPETLFIEKGVAFQVSETNEEGEVICLIGERDSVSEIKDQIISIARCHASITLECPFWMCYLFESNEAYLKAINKVYPTISHTVDVSKQQIRIEGDEKLIVEAHALLRSVINDTVKVTCHAILEIPNSYLSTIVGRGQMNLKSIMEETRTHIFVEKDQHLKWTMTALSPPSNVEVGKRGEAEAAKATTTVKKDHAILIIVGSKHNLNQAKNRLNELIQHRARYVTQEIDAPAHLHKQIIGPKGSYLKELTEKYGPSCSVHFEGGFTHGNDRKSSTYHKDKDDKGIIEGPPEEVASLHDALVNKIKELEIAHTKIQFEIPKKHHYMIIGRGGSFLNHVKRVTGIELLCFPAENEISDVVVVIGPQASAIKAKEMLLAKYQEVSALITVHSTLPEKAITLLKGSGSYILKTICKDADGNVQVRVLDGLHPKDKGKISIVGSKEAVEFAQSALSKLAKNDYSDYYMEEMKVAARYLPEIIGSKGANLSKIASATSATIYTYEQAADKDTSMETIVIVGKPDAVKKARAILEEDIKKKENSMEQRIKVTAAFKNEFFSKRGDQPSNFARLTSDYSGHAQIIFLDKNSATSGGNSLEVVIKGSKSSVPEVCERIQKYIQEFESYVEKVIPFSANNMVTLLGRNKAEMRDIMTKYNVWISLPSEFFPEGKSKETNPMIDVAVRGTPENVNNAINAIKDLTFVSETVFFHRVNHKDFRGNKNQALQEFRAKYKVDVKLGTTDNPDLVIITGKKADVVAATEYISNLSARYHYHVMKIDPKHFTRIIGKEGSKITKFNKDYKVHVVLPREGAPEPDNVVIVGDKKCCEVAAEVLSKKIHEWDFTITDEITFDHRARQSVLGTNGANIRKIGQNFNVRIKLLGSGTSEAGRNNELRKLAITGLPENVKPCKDHLLELIASTIEDIEDREMYFISKEAGFELDVSNIDAFNFGKQQKINMKATAASDLKSSSRSAIQENNRAYSVTHEQLTQKQQSSFGTSMTTVSQSNASQQNLGSEDDACMTVTSHDKA